MLFDLFFKNIGYYFKIEISCVINIGNLHSRGRTPRSDIVTIVHTKIDPGSRNRIEGNSLVTAHKQVNDLMY